MKKKIIFSSILVIAFILVISNMFILLNTDKIARSKAMNEYVISDNGILQKKLSTKGIVIPSDQYSIQLDTSLGKVYEAVVEEGTVISAGDTLIEYNTRHIDNDILSFEQQRENLINQSSKLEEDLSLLEQELYDPFNVEEEDIAQNYDTLSSQISDKEFQIKELELRIDQINQNIEKLQLDKESYTITSKIDGTVISVNPYAQSDKDTIVSITSELPYLIEGKLSEKEVVKVQEGQKVFASAVVLPKQKNEGIVQELKMTPLGNPSVDDKESFYPFIIEMNEPIDSWHEGFHVNIDIILEERNGVIVIPDSSVLKKADNTYVYVIKNGQLELRKVQLGLRLNNRQEVVEGLEKGERIVRIPTKDLKNKMEIFMPINHLYLKRDTFESFTKDQTLRLLIKGLLQ